MKPNDQQVKVIEHFDGPCLVTAVPGSGKTACVTARTSALLKQGVDPSSILAITFTNKAADEMKARIAKEVGAAAKRMTICTFHSLCARMIRENAVALGYTTKFSIYDDDDQWRAMRTAVIKIEGEPLDGKELPVAPEYVQKVMTFIEATRNSDLTTEAALSKYHLVNKQLAVVEAYYAELKKSNAIDFTGLLSEALRLLRSFPDVLATYQKRWKYISVDEVQDTNVSQYEIVKLLGAHGNMLCVGDFDQSVYGFRFASPQNIMAFEKDFKAKALKLETNYRSTPEILGKAHALIVHNQDRKDSVLRTDNKHGSEPISVVLDTDDLMAMWVGQEILHLIKVRHEKPSEIAIFYRVNFASRVLERVLRHLQIPFKVYGDVGFFKRKEIKGSLAILRLLANPNDKTAFETATGICCRGIGPKSCAGVYEYAEKHKLSVMHSAFKLSVGTGYAAQKLGVFTANYSQAEKPYEVLSKMLERTAFSENIIKDSTPDNDRVANVKELIVELHKHMAAGGTLEEYLQYVSLLTSADDKGDQGKVKLMTMHRSKGLEFDNVFLTHVNANLLPHERCSSVGDDEERRRQIEEERRLLYVAMTRARKNLWLSSCLLASKKETEPSPFLLEAGFKPKKIDPF